MWTVGIIGLGTITKYYQKGIRASDYFSLTCVCDIDPDAPSGSFFPEAAFYTNYQEMIREATPDFVIISTPPATHFAIAGYALNQGVNVIIEKPATLNIEDYRTLRQLAEEKSLIFEVSFHWQNGIEVLAFNREYTPEKISQISVTVLDPYSADGIIIDPAKRKLMGAWVDSGVNALSMIAMWLPMINVEILSLDKQLCPESGLPIYIDANLLIDSVPTRICIDWRKHTNSKQTMLNYDGDELLLDHSAQAIVRGDASINYGRMERLQEHYYHYFRSFRGHVEADQAQRIHETLFKVVQTL